VESQLRALIDLRLALGELQAAILDVDHAIQELTKAEIANMESKSSQTGQDGQED